MSERHSSSAAALLSASSRCSSKARLFARPVSASRRASAWVRASLRSLTSADDDEVGHRRDELGIGDGLDVGRERDQEGAERLTVCDERGGNRLGAGSAEPVELAELVRIGPGEQELRESAGDDTGGGAAANRAHRGRRRRQARASPPVDAR